MSLFAELAKRRVFATAAIYIPAAWLAAEILLAIFDRFEAPPWAGDIVVILFLLGFPVVLLLSWLFDVTGEGVKRASPGTPLGIVTLLASGLFLSIGSYVSYQAFSGRLDEISIAVLPFHTSELNEAAAPYGSGVADDIRSSLRQLPVFRVPAQTSSEAVLGMGLDIPGIASRLGVEYVLEGTLELVGDQLQIDVVLLDEGGGELWSERYERAVRDLFELQHDLLRSLSSELGVQVSNPSLQAQLSEPAPTNDPEAHRLYLSGRILPEDYDKPEAERRKMQAFMAARQRDPGYAAVYAAIAKEYANECWILDDRTSHKCDLAIQFAEQGIELDRQLADAWAVLAMVRALRYDWTGAQEAIDHFNSLPSRDVVSGSLAAAYWNLGRFQEAWAALVEAYENDPLNPENSWVLGAWAYFLLGDRELSDRFATLARELNPGMNYGGWPDIAVHRVPLDQAIENARQSYDTFKEGADWAPVIVPIIYGEAEAESAWPEIDRWLAEGSIRPATYWWMLAYVNRIDEYIDLSFELFDEKSLNPAWMLMSVPNHEAIRSHPRFMELMEYIGYAQFWDQAGWPRYCTFVNSIRQCGGGPAAVEEE
jgi:TolB-like protein